MSNALAELPARDLTNVNQEAQAFDLLQRQGRMLAESELVPDIYKKKVADCSLIVEISGRIKASPLLVANNLDIIYGRPSWRSQFLIACVNQSGRFTALRYEWKGEPGTKTRGCRAWAIERETQDRLDGVWIDWQMVDAEGWAERKGSKWKTMPDQMFVYRAAAFWTRAYAPEIALGFPTNDEVQDVIDVTPMAAEGSKTVDELNRRIGGSIPGTAQRVPDSAAASSPTAGSPATDPTTGEIFGAAVSYATIMESIQKATTIDALDMAKDLMRSIADDKQRAELDVEERAKRKALTK